VTALDDEVGRLVSYLHGRATLDDTIVVYSADHGDMLGSHGMFGKNVPHEESSGIPLVIRAPGRIPAGLVSDLPVGIVDYAPTFLGLLGVPVPEQMQGEDLSPELLRGEPSVPRTERAIFLTGEVDLDGMWADLDDDALPWRGLRQGRWTYARNLHGPWVLFDNEHDRWQLHNLVDDPAHRDIRDKLDTRLDQLIAAAGDPLLSARALAEHLGLDAEWNAMQQFWEEVWAEVAAARAAGDTERLERAMALMI
jgi:arylsulfatase A-like enzyme